MFVFVSDFFLEDYSGGGELTSDAILRGTKIPVRTIHSHKVTREIVDAFKDRHWIFGNFANLSIDMLLYCCKNLDYSVVEYDYKYCKFRLPKKHEVAEGSCDCENSPNGKLVKQTSGNKIKGKKVPGIWMNNRNIETLINGL